MAVTLDILKHIISPTNSNSNINITPDGTGSAIIKNPSLTGKIVQGTRRTVAITGNILSSDWYIGVTAVPLTLTLTTGSYATNQQFVIKDESGGASANNITIDTQGAETIDGAATALISTNFGSLSILFDGTNFHLF